MNTQFDVLCGLMGSMLIRDLRESEVHAALRLVLPSMTPLDDERDARARHFLAYLAAQNLTVDWRLGIVEGQRLLGACLGIISPGRNAMILQSDCSADSSLCRALADALVRIEHRAQQNDVILLQSLIPDLNTGRARALQWAEYEYLADLRYLTLVLPAPAGDVPCDPEFVVVDYTSADKALFLRTLEQTYVGSQDCPALSGLRSTADIVLSHRHTGIHDPKLWLMALMNGEPVGILLLTHVPLRPAMEIVYVGVVPQARGRSYGRLLVRLAIEAASRAHKDHLMLAVDRRNHYALKIYGALGFTETDRRHAWIRSLPS